jgi:hypothetical protein
VLRILIFAILAGVPAHAAIDASTAALQSRAASAGLADTTEWRNLLHFPEGRARSDILPSDFFLSPQGHLDPNAELSATIAALAAPEPGTPGSHAICDYPARLAFLRDRLDWSPRVEPTCPERRAWTRDGAITGASLVFASGDFANPASFFGHLLMRFTTGEGDDAFSDAFDQGLNFGALVPRDENMLVYMVRGLTGGYLSSYSHGDYFSEHHAYAEIQQRAVWEYRLDLNPEQVSFLVNHSWELRRARWRYYFFTKNCASEFARLIEIALGRPARPVGKPWATPIDVFETVARMRHADGRPVVSEIRGIPSRQARFRAVYDQLDGSEAEALHAFVSGDPTALDGLDPTTRARVLDAALQYLSFARSVASDEEKDEIAGLSSRAVIQRLRLPSGSELTVPDRLASPPPHEGHGSTMVSFGAFRNSRLGTGAILEVRPALSDFLSLDAGTLANSELQALSLSVIATEGDVALRRFDLFSIGTLAASTTGVGLDHARPFRLRAGVEARSLGCTDCLVAFAEGGLGTALFATEGHAAAAFLDVRAEGGSEDGSALELGPGLITTGSLGPSMKYRLAASMRTDLLGSGEPRRSLDLGLRLGASETWDVRLDARAEKGFGEGLVTEVGGSIRLHF